MKHTTVLLIKFISCIIAFAVGLDLFFDADFVDVLSFSVFVTAASYLIGDRIVLPQLGNYAALVVDFFLVYLSVWIFGSFLLHSYLQVAWGSGIAAVMITATEVFVHSYLVGRLAMREEQQERRASFNPRLAYGTEIAEEQDIRAIKHENEKTDK